MLLARALILCARSAIVFASVVFCAHPAAAQDDTQPPPDAEELDGLFIRKITIRRTIPDEPAGVTAPLDDATEQLVRNQLRSTVGNEYRHEFISDDIARLNRLGRFALVENFVQLLDDGTVELIYIVTEQPIIQDVQVVGNRRVSDQDIAEVVDLIPGTPVDQFQLDRSRRAIEELYRQKGFFRASVNIDELELEETGIVLFRVQEAERIKITDIRFDGNDAFTPKQLKARIKTKVAWLLDKGVLDYDVLDTDITSIISFYRDRGYLDIRVGRRITESPNGKEAIITFVIEEGDLYILRSVDVIYVSPLGGEDPNGVFSDEQILALMEINPGDVYGLRALQKSLTAIHDAHLRLGYTDARYPINEENRDPMLPLVDLNIIISQGERFFTGEILIQGNDRTQDKIIRRQIPFRPERPLSGAQIEEARTRINRMNLVDNQFKPPKITAQQPRDAEPNIRDVLVQVKETNTGSFSIGGALSSDAGITARIQYNQRNFDVLDTPDSFDEFFKGRAFRGAGQTFDITVLPGTQVQTYAIAIGDPYMFESNYSGNFGAFFRNRRFDDYDEQRWGGNIAIGRRFGTRWNGALRFRFQNVELSDISPDAPVDIFESAGPDTLTGLELSMSRTTLNNFLRPSRGTKTELSAEQVGIAGGDFTFTKLNAQHSVYMTLHESFEGYRTILELKGRASWIPQGRNETPVYERYYLGGQNFRGFDFRTVSPKGISASTGLQTSEPIGGTWLFFAGAEITQPIVNEFISLVAFVDTGTVTFEPGFDEYRVSIGFGFRLYIPQLSPAPLAFDFGFPILKQTLDEERLFSFSVDLPF